MKELKEQFPVLYCESNIQVILSYRVTALVCISHIILELTVYVYPYKTYRTFRNQHFW
jgi:hypothetical protein